MLDSSALIAVLNDEPGADKVAEVMASASISAVNHSEVIGYLLRKRMTADQAVVTVRSLNVDVIVAEEATAEIAGKLSPITSKAGLSLGDRFCLATAKVRGLPVLTADRAWAQVADDVEVEVVTIR